MSRDDIQRWKDKYLENIEQQERLQQRWDARIDLLRRGLVRSSLAAEGSDKAVDQCMKELREILRRDDMDAGLSGLIPRLEKAVLDSEQRRQQRTQQNIDALGELAQQLLALNLPRELRKPLKQFARDIEERARQSREIPILLSELSRLQRQALAERKGGVAMVLHALALLRQQGFRDYGRITVLFNPDEETGSAGSKQLIAELARQQDYVFSYEPPDRDAVTVATNGIDGLLLEVKGRSSHAGSAPEQGRNAILELSHQLLRLKDLGDPAKGTTLNWTLARGGEKRNIIPAEASAEADMRYSDPAESERVLADARKLTGERLVADTEVSLRLDKGRPPLVKNPASQRLAETAQTLYGRIGKRIEPIAMRFGTDAGYAYVPGSDKPAVLETLGVVGAGLHSEAEYLELSSIAPRLYLTVALIRELSAD